MGIEYGMPIRGISPWKRNGIWRRIFDAPAEFEYARRIRFPVSLLIAAIQYSRNSEFNSLNWAASLLKLNKAS